MAQGAGIGVITEMIFGYLYPGRPLANMVFRCYGVTGMGQALWFISDFKLGHYMKIPPKSMFIMQVLQINNNIMTSINFHEIFKNNKASHY